MAPRCVQACSPWHFGRPGREPSRQPLRDFNRFAAWTSGRRGAALRGRYITASGHTPMNQPAGDPTMKRILIVGAGFAGMHAALSAARLRDKQGVSPDTLDIVVAAPEPRLVIRPRLYERAPETMVAPLGEVFDAVDVRYERGRVDVIDSASRSAVI